MREISGEHLSDEDFERLALSASRRGAFSRREAPETHDAALAKALRHIENCDVCRDIVQRDRVATRILDQLKTPSASEARGDCPPASEWPLVAAGQVESGKAGKYLRHAAECDHCGPLMRQATVEFDDEFASDEEEMIAQLKSSDPAWQKQFARELAAKSPSHGRAKVLRGRWTTFRKWQPWALAAAAAIVAAVILFPILSRYFSQTPDKLLAQAYRERRNLELRFEGAQHGPVRIERGGDSRLNRPAALLEAEALIARGLEKEPDSPVWLQAKGRADLLEGNYEAAVQSFQRASELQPDSVSLQTDLASAYFQRAERADRASDYGRAIELLSKVLAKNPDDAVARFNRALVNERMFLYRQALEDWEHYLRLDANGEWANEATQHVNSLRQKLSEQNRSAAESLLDPAAFVNVNQDELQRRSEDYLDAAVREWLPKTVNDPSSTEQALERLAVILRDAHHDPWLSDLLKSPRSSIAILALAEAAVANATGDFTRAQSSAIRSQQLFQAAGNVAGSTRAQLEDLYALDRSGQAQECLISSDLLEREAGKYRWIQIQLFMERSNCLGQLGRFNEAQQAVETSLSLARNSGYGTVFLRAVGLAAAQHTDQGNTTAAASLDREGLARYWEGVYPPIRAYQFYSDLGFHAEKREQWNFALALAKEAVAAIALSPQRLGEAFARHRLAKTAVQAGDPELAIAEFDRARHLFAELPQTDVTRTYRADGEIELARLETNRGNLDRASEHLSTARAQLPTTMRYQTALNFYRTLGELHRVKGDPIEAEKTFRAALTVTERGLNSLRDEREREVWVREMRDVYRALAEIKWEANDVEAALNVWEWYRGAALRKATETSRTSDSIELARLDVGPSLRAMPPVRELGDRTSVVYLETPKRLLIWVIDEQGVTGTQVPIAQDELKRLAARFSEQCGNRNSDLAALRKHARQLYDLLIGPISDRLAKRSIQTLVIETDQSMANIPLGALIDPHDRFLGDSYDIVLSRGRLHRRTINTNISSSQKALIVGSPALTGNLAESLEPLGDALEEAHYVGSKFKSSTLLTGRRATLETVKQELPRSELFHFAGHALINVGLLLARSDSQTHHEASDTAVLTSNDLSSLDLSSIQLAVFSACSTAKDDDAGDNNAESLVNRFLRAVVSQVLATRWNVDSKITAQFMRIFYDNLLSGASVVSSVRAAELQLRTNTETQHPYYWAAFSVFSQ
ncbi:MAG TPA: CHAT domain-containing protein [Pyrinomonadaceae bacterium]|nr:CHAT domain-containing protein [Pyrinomonadaceae bacterium]